MCMQVPGQGIMLHQSVPTVCDSFAPAKPVSKGCVSIAVTARVMKLMPANGLTHLRHGILPCYLCLHIPQSHKPFRP